MELTEEQALSVSQAAREQAWLVAYLPAACDRACRRLLHEWRLVARRVRHPHTHTHIRTKTNAHTHPNTYTYIHTYTHLAGLGRPPQVLSANAHEYCYFNINSN